MRAGDAGGFPLPKAARRCDFSSSPKGTRRCAAWTATEAVCANTGALSGGDLYGLLDTVAYLAVITLAARTTKPV